MTHIYSGREILDCEANCGGDSVLESLSISPESIVESAYYVVHWPSHCTSQKWCGDILSVDGPYHEYEAAESAAEKDEY